MPIIKQTVEDTIPSVALLDDDQSMVTAISEVLTAYGFTVVSFTSPDHFRRSMSFAFFDAYVLDWNLQGENCLDLLEDLRNSQTGRDKPIFILTGDAQAAHGSPCELLSAVDRLRLIFCQKPYSTKKLAADLRAALAGTLS